MDWQTASKITNKRRIGLEGSNRIILGVLIAGAIGRGPCHVVGLTFEALGMDEDSLPGRASAGPSAGVSIWECREMIKKSLQLPKVKFLRENLEKSGCKVGDNFIRAINCHNHMAGGYAPSGGIFVCSNEMSCQDDVNQVILHELIHAYDECRAANLDWTDCANHACAEIRANHLSGDCHFKRELLRGNLKIGGQESECIKRRVMKSVTSNPYCSAEAAREGMEAVWNVCYNDTQPFDRAL